MTRGEAEKEIGRLSDVLRRYEYEYHVLNSPTVSDVEYDRLFDKLVELERQFPDLRTPESPTVRVGSDLSSDLPEVEHTIPVLSLDKAYSAEELQTWIDKISAQAAETVSFIVEEKIDGISIVLYYEEGRLVRAVTRGNGYVGNDVTDNVKTIRTVPLRLRQDVTIAVRGEIFLPVARFEALNAEMEEPYANPRNLAAGTLRRVKSADVAAVPLDMLTYEGHSGEDASHLDVMARLHSLGFKLNDRIGFFSESGVLSADSPFAAAITAGTYGDLAAYIQKSVDERVRLPYEIDGLVIKVNEIPVREALGFTGHHPRWEIAYKFESPQGATVVNAIDVQVGRTGRITPVARVSPVSIGGSTVSNVTLHNQDYIDILELSVGDTVAVSKRGDVIPAVESVIEKNEDGNPTWRMPESCPSCDRPLETKGAHHFCINAGCPAQVRSRLFFFVGRNQMDIDNLGPETVEGLIRDYGISKIEEIYSFEFDRLMDAKGFGEKKVDLIKRGIEKSKDRPFRAVLPSLGIPDLGPSITDLLIEAGYRDIDAIFTLADEGNVATFTEIEGIGEKTAESIIRALSSPEIRRSIEALRQAGLKFEAPMLEEDLASNAAGGGTASGGTPAAGPANGAGSVGTAFAGQIWCVTGTFKEFKPRELALEEIRRRSGKTVSQVSGATTHLLAGEGAGSKLQKAQKLGVKIVGEEDFLRMLGK